MAKALVSHRPHSPWQHVAQIAFHELNAFEGFDSFDAAMRPVFPTEADVGVGDAHDTAVAYGGAADIASEVSYDVLPVAKGLQMHAPVLSPYCGVHFRQARMLPSQVMPTIPKAGTEEFYESSLGHEEVIAFDGHDTTVGIESGTGNDDMEMRMKVQSLVPCVEDHGEPGGGGPEPFGMGEDVAQGGGGALEKELINLSGMVGEEHGAECFRQGQGDHEIG